MNSITIGVEKKRKIRIPSVLLIGIAIIGMLFSFAAWAISSPVGASPDDDYHLASIWCPTPVANSGCEYRTEGSVITQIKVPKQVAATSGCLAFQTEKDASCTADISNSDSVFTDRFNQGSYPWGYYQFHHLLVGKDVWYSIVVMRVVNLLIGVGGVLIGGGLSPLAIRHHVILASVAAWVPMGVYFIASNNPSSWAISGCMIFATGLLSSTQSSDRRRWALLAMAVYGGLIAITSRADSAFYLFVIALAVWFLVKIDRTQLAPLITSLLLSIIAIRTMLSTGQSRSITGGGGWPVDSGASFARIFVANLLSLPEYIASWWGLTWGPGWFDVPLFGWSTLMMLMLAGGIFFVAAQDVFPRKILGSGVVLGALLGIPVVGMTLRHVHPLAYYQGRYMLPLLGVLLLFWLTRRNKNAQFIAPAQLILFTLVVSVANSLALRRLISRYTHGIQSSDFIAIENAEWWPWSFSPSIAWVVGSLGFFVGVSVLLYMTTRSVRDNILIAAYGSSAETTIDGQNLLDRKD